MFPVFALPDPQSLDLLQQRQHAAPAPTARGARGFAQIPMSQIIPPTSAVTRNTELDNSSTTELPAVHRAPSDLSRRELEQVEKKLVRKLDTFLLSAVALMNCFNAIDKTLLPIARIQGLPEDLSMTHHQFNMAVAVFQLGFLTLQLPSNLLITRVRPQFYLSFCCLAWSIVAACHAAVTNYHQLLAVRILLGICDAPFMVGSIHLLSSWYTRRELARRTSVVLSVLIVVLTFIFPISGGLVTALNGALGLSGWRWLYLIFGVLGMFVALAGLFCLPDYPGSRPWWLTEAQAELAKRRMVADAVAPQVQGSMVSGVVAAVMDVRTWVFVLMFFSRRIFEGFFAYLPTFFRDGARSIVPHAKMSDANLGLLLGSPPALIAAVAAFLLAWSSDKRNERTFHVVIPLLVGLAGLIVTAINVDHVARYVSIYFYLGGSVIGSGMSWAWVANVIQETPEKKAAAIGLVGVVGGVGAIVGPFLFRGRDSPNYRLGFGILAAFTVLDIGTCLGMRFLLKRQNARLRRRGETGQYTL